MRAFCLSLLSISAIVIPHSPAFAEKAPLSIAKLTDRADAIVVATIHRIRVEVEPSHFERGVGNSDWGIYLTLKVEDVEKGDVSENELEARCFRIRRRRSLTEYMTPSGHHPIPAVGTQVRVYLQRDGSGWHVVLPNGITAVQGVAEWPGSELEDAQQVERLGGRAFAFLLPLEIWIVLLAVCVPLLIGGALLLRFLKRRQLKKGGPPKPSLPAETAG